MIHDSLYDTLSSSAGSANVLTSKVISARAGQHVKLDFREFLETFNECWNFVVRCEIIGRKMVVGLRGTVVSQVRVEAQSWKCVGLTYLDRPSHSSRYYTRLESASLPSWSVRLLARSFLSLLTNTTIAVYLQTRATCTRNSPCSKLPACQPPSSKHSSQISASPLRPSPHGQRRPLHPRPCRYPPATSRHYANEATLALLKRAHQGHALAQQHRATRTRPCPGSRTPRKAGRIQAGRRAAPANADCKQQAAGAVQRHRADADIDVDAVLQGDEEAAEHQPPTLAKDEALAGSRTPALVAVAVGTSEA
jgi:hypothetical protein